VFFLAGKMHIFPKRNLQMKKTLAANSFPLHHQINAPSNHYIIFVRQMLEHIRVK